MRVVLLWFLLQCASRIGDARDSSRIDGLVLDDATGAPVSKAVVLLASDFSPGLARYGAVTNSSGEFSVPEIEPGKYVIKVERAGYLRPPHGLPLDVPAGRQPAGITLKLTREGIVAGRVTGQEASPSAPYQPKLWKTTFRTGYRTAEPVVHAVFAASDGSFMIGNLSPGRYFLEKPGLSLGEATVLDVTAGSIIRGIEVRQQPAAIYRISGVIRNPAPEGRLDAAYVYLQVKDPSGSWVTLPTYAPVNQQTGVFTFRSIPRGDYRIGATISVKTGDTSRKYSGQREVQLRGRSETDVTLTFTPMAVVTGTISEEAGLPARSQPLYVTLYGKGLDHSGDSAKVASASTFRLQVTPGRHGLFAGNGSENVRFVKSIRFNGRETSGDSPLEVPPEGGALEIVLGGPGREIVGTIRDAAGRSSAGATVAAWTDEGALRTAQTDADGRFTIWNAPRGQVYFAAWESAPGNAWEMESFRAAFRRRAAKAPAQSPSRVTVEMTVIPRVASEAEVAKLR